MAARNTVSAASAAPPRFWLRPEPAGAHSRSGGRAVLPPTRVQALLTPVPTTVQIQMESSVLPDTAPNCTANPRVAAVLHAAMRGQTDAAVYDCDAGTLRGPAWPSCSATRSSGCAPYRYTVHGGLNAHITVTFDWVYPDDGPARREGRLARTADGLLPPPRRRTIPVRCISTTGCWSTCASVPRETYDQTAYAAVCEGEVVCGGISDATSTCSKRGGIPARASSRVRPCPPTARREQPRLGAAGSSTARPSILRPHLGPAGRRARRRCRIISATVVPLSRPSAWPCATRPRTPPSGRTKAAPNADNYYVRNGYTAAEASIAAAAAAVRSQWDDGRAVLEFRCETPEVLRPGMRSLLFDRDRLWDVTVRSAATCPRPATSARTTSRSSA